MSAKKATDLVPLENANIPIFVSNYDAEPVVLGEVLEQMGLNAPRLTAQELIGKSFDIVRFRCFDSQFENQDRAAFCVIRLLGSEIYHTAILGGRVVMDYLELYALSGDERPLRVHLDWQEGGRYGGYYTIG